MWSYADIRRAGQSIRNAAPDLPDGPVLARLEIRDKAVAEQ